MKNILILIVALLYAGNLFAQEEKLSKKAEKDILKQLQNQMQDTDKQIAEAGHRACKCIDSIEAELKNLSPNDNEAVQKGVVKCINEEVKAYNMMQQLSKALFSKKKKNTIYINDNTESEESIIVYRKLERWLNDSCPSIREIAKSNNSPTSKKSYGENEKAQNFYNAGSEKYRAQKWEEALLLFNMAVEMDPEFAFAWDNIGVCERNLNHFDKALIAYKKSIAIDPKGVTPYQNSAYIYMNQKKYEEAVEAYKMIGKLNPEDPESFYGIGTAYIAMQGHNEAALKNLCIAYNLYSKQKSPYRTDAEKLISTLYREYKKQDNVKGFNKILEENNITPVKD
jgi:tetratricopeptide (TPR) repeat protein